MNKVYIEIKQSPVKDNFNVRFDIPEDQALDPLDVGEVSCIALRPQLIDFEIQGYKEMGYEPSIYYQNNFVMDAYLKLKEV